MSKIAEEESIYQMIIQLDIYLNNNQDKFARRKKAKKMENHQHQVDNPKEANQMENPKEANQMENLKEVNQMDKIKKAILMLKKKKDTK